MKLKTIPFEGELTEDQVSNIKKWVETLRSGGYMQGRGLLIKENSYCCLGVACKIKGVKSDGHGFFIGKERRSLSPCSNWFKEEYGFNYEDGVVLDPTYGKVDLMFVNDEYEFTFEKIADVIEACFIHRKEIELKC